MARRFHLSLRVSSPSPSFSAYRATATGISQRDMPSFCVSSRKSRSEPWKGFQLDNNFVGVGSRSVLEGCGESPKRHIVRYMCSRTNDYDDKLGLYFRHGLVLLAAGIAAKVDISKKSKFDASSTRQSRVCLERNTSCGENFAVLQIMRLL